MANISQPMVDEAAEKIWASGRIVTYSAVLERLHCRRAELVPYMQSILNDSRQKRKSADGITQSLERLHQAISAEQQALWSEQVAELVEENEELASKQAALEAAEARIAELSTRLAAANNPGERPSGGGTPLRAFCAGLFLKKHGCHQGKNTPIPPIMSIHKSISPGSKVAISISICRAGCPAERPPWFADEHSVIAHPAVMLGKSNGDGLFQRLDVAEYNVPGLQPIQLLPTERRTGYLSTKEDALVKAPHPKLRVAFIRVDGDLAPGKRCHFRQRFPCDIGLEFMEGRVEGGLEFYLLFHPELLGAGEAGFDGVQVGDDSLLLRPRR